MSDRYTAALNAIKGDTLFNGNREQISKKEHESICMALERVSKFEAVLKIIAHGKTDAGENMTRVCMRNYARGAICQDQK